MLATIGAWCVILVIVAVVLYAFLGVFFDPEA